MSMLTPHGACLSWQPELIWLNAVSDAMVAVAFFATAFVLGFYVWRRRREVMFRSVFWSLAIFAAVGGVARIVSIVTLWVPAHSIEGLTKALLALIAIAMTTEMLRMVGLVVPELGNPIFPALAEVVGGALAQRGFNAVLCTRTGSMSEAQYVEMLAQYVDDLRIPQTAPQSVAA